MNKRINPKMASNRSSMVAVKLGPMRLQCDKLQRDVLDNYRQPLQESRRGHGKTGNMPTTNRFKEERAHKSSEHVKKTYKEDTDSTPCPK